MTRNFRRISAALTIGLLLGNISVMTYAQAAAPKKPTVSPPPKVCYHWSHGKWTAHPCW